MLIEVWSDYVCPFCYVGKRLLEQALAQTGIEAQVVYKSFELDPVSESDPNTTVFEELAQKYNTTVEEAEKMTNQVGERTKTVGLNYNFANQKKTNTLDVHRLAKLAESKGLEKEFVEQALHAYFIEAKFLGDENVLIELASSVGLNEDEVKQILSSQQFSDEVRKDQEEARMIGVQGVPFFVFDRKYALSGAQPLEVFVSALQQVQKERQ